MLSPSLSLSLSLPVPLCLSLFLSLVCLQPHIHPFRFDLSKTSGPREKLRVLHLGFTNSPQVLLCLSKFLVYSLMLPLAHRFSFSLLFFLNLVCTFLLPHISKLHRINSLSFPKVLRHRRRSRPRASPLIYGNEADITLTQTRHRVLHGVSYELLGLI